MPKKLTFIEIFTTCLFAMAFQQIVDLVLDLKLNWYGYFSKGIQWAYLIPILGVYPAVNAVFLNYYQYMDNLTKKLWFIIGCSVFAVVYEFLAVKSGYFYHHQWKIWHSAILYPFLFVFLILILKWLRILIQHQYERKK